MKALVMLIPLLIVVGVAFVDAGEMDPPPFPPPATPWAVLQQQPALARPPLAQPPAAQPPPPVAHVNLRASAHGCPARGSRWTEELVATSPVVELDCPVGVSYKTWASGRRVHVGIRTTIALHPGNLTAGAAVEYVLVAPQFR